MKHTDVAAQTISLRWCSTLGGGKKGFVLVELRPLLGRSQVSCAVCWSGLEYEGWSAESSTFMLQ